MRAKLRRLRRSRPGNPSFFPTVFPVGLLSSFSASLLLVLVLRADSHPAEPACTLELPRDRPESKHLPQLTEDPAGLRQVAEASGTTLLVALSPDPLARYERVVEVMDASVRARVRHLDFYLRDSN